MHKKRPQAVRVKPSGDPDRAVELALDEHHESAADGRWHCFHLTRTQARTVMLALTAELGVSPPEPPRGPGSTSIGPPRHAMRRNPRSSPHTMSMRVYRIDADTGEEVELSGRQLFRTSELPILSTMAYPACRCARCTEAARK